MGTYVVSDIHGHYDKWIEAEKKSGLRLDKGDHYIILGDLLDRGEKSKECIEYALKLIEKYPRQVTYIMGNHEYLMLEFTSLIISKNMTVEQEEELYRRGGNWLGNGGTQSVASFLGYLIEDSEDIRTLKEIHWLMNMNYRKLLGKIGNLPLYKIDEEKGVVYVHAGFRTGIKLSEQKKFDMQWIREEFINNYKPLEGDVLEGKLIIHGHTPVKQIRGYTGRGYHRGKNHLCLDGGAAVQDKILILRLEDMSYIENHF